MLFQAFDIFCVIDAFEFLIFNEAVSLFELQYQISFLHVVYARNTMQLITQQITRKQNVNLAILLRRAWLCLRAE